MLYLFLRNAACLASFVVLLAGCAERPSRPSIRTWIMGAVEPSFDPDGPPSETRWALERMLTRGLVDLDSLGVVRAAGADRWSVTPDGRTYAFRIRSGLVFADSTRCTSADFQHALEAGLARRDHGTWRWLLRRVRGVDKVREGRPLPDLGLAAPNDSTLIITLDRPDSAFLATLALPGVSYVWREREANDWSHAIGIGPYRVVERLPARRLKLVPAARFPAPDADTLTVLFGLGARSARSLMRSRIPDLVWPMPTELLDELLPEGYRRVSREADPRRKLLLIVRPNVPPTTRLAARHALSHGVNPSAIVRSLGPRGRPLDHLIDGAGRFEFARFDAEEVRYWLERGRMGRSFHVIMAYDADGPAAEVARTMQGDWARLSVYVDLLPLRGKRLTQEMLNGRSQLLLVELQALEDGAAADLASLIEPPRGGPIGNFASGFKTREFERVLDGRSGQRPWVAQAQRRLTLEKVAIPLADLPWVWVERDGRPGVAFHPRFGPAAIDVAARERVAP